MSLPVNNLSDPARIIIIECDLPTLMPGSDHIHVRVTLYVVDLLHILCDLIGIDYLGVLKGVVLEQGVGGVGNEVLGLEGGEPGAGCREVQVRVDRLLQFGQEGRVVVVRGVEVEVGGVPEEGRMEGTDREEQVLKKVKGLGILLGRGGDGGPKRLHHYYLRIGRCNSSFHRMYLRTN